ncbi:glycosyltransferase [Candidatus Gottesmanbacteria bacterium]|nr:glycosyltransferase [Candidatus Gottesmanbacteria bacterium]
MKNSSLTVIIPTYNEAENIVPLLREIQKYIPAFSTILVVDDNSPDGTARLVKTNTHVKLLVRTGNRGLTNSLRDGISATKSDIVAWMDCDFSHPPEVLPKLLSGVQHGADIVLATRIHNHGLSLLLNRLSMLLFGTSITDYTTGFLAARREVLSHIPLRGNYGEYCIDLLVRAQRKGYRIEEIPYASPPRRYGQSKTAPNISTLIRHGYGYIETVLRLLWTIKFQHR